MTLQLFNGSEVVTLTIEDNRYKPVLSLEKDGVVVSAELTAADMERIVEVLDR